MVERTERLFDNKLVEHLEKRAEAIANSNDKLALICVDGLPKQASMGHRTSNVTL
jgi:hypothetical protein